LIDAGYYSESNIDTLFEEKIDFLTRLPAGRTLYHEIITNHSGDIEKLENAYTMGKRGYFAKLLEINLYGHKAHAYLILDPERKAKNIKELLQEYCSSKSERDKKRDQFAFLSCGLMVLVSSKKMPINEILSSYYLRQSIEQIFSFSKSDLNLLPIRNHNDKTVQGYLFFQFLLLIFYIKIREKYLKQYTVEQLSLILRKLKCKVYESRIIPLERDKKQREIFEQANILVPKFLGI
jgi:transposase